MSRKSPISNKTLRQRMLESFYYGLHQEDDEDLISEVKETQTMQEYKATLLTKLHELVTLVKGLPNV